jgi:hypothetical protein
MSDNKKGKWLEKMKSDNVLKTKTQNTFIDNTIEFNSKDNALYSFVSLLLSMVCCFANQFLHFFVFKESFGIIGTFLVGIFFIFFTSAAVKSVENKVNEGKVPRDLLRISRMISVILRDGFYYIALSKFVPTSILLFVIFGTTALYCLFNFTSFERCGIGVYSLKSVLLQLLFAYSLYQVVDFKLFIWIVSCLYLVLLMQNVSRPIIARTTKKGIEQVIERDINSKYGDKVRVEVKSER